MCTKMGHSNALQVVGILYKATSELDAVVMMKGWQWEERKGHCFVGSDRIILAVEVIENVVKALVVNNNELES